MVVKEVDVEIFEEKKQLLILIAALIQMKEEG